MLPAGVTALAPALYQSRVRRPRRDPARPTRSRASPTTRRRWPRSRRCRPVRILFDNGAGGPSAGRAGPGFEQSFSRFPLPGTQARSWYLGAGGTLDRRGPARRPAPTLHVGPGGAAADRLQRQHRLRARTGCGRRRRPTTGPQNPAGTAAVLPHRPAGRGHHRRRRRRAAGLDPLLGAETSTSRSPSPRCGPTARRRSCRAAGCAADARKLDAARARCSTPVPSLREGGRAAAARGRYARSPIPLYYEGHVYRAGSRIRVTISAPGGDQPIWAFGAARPPSGHADR